MSREYTVFASIQRKCLAYPHEPRLMAKERRTPKLRVDTLRDNAILEDGPKGNPKLVRPEWIT